MVENFNSLVVRATKWSTLSEVVSKLITPISTIFLARLLTPEDFGVLVTATMVISFAEIFTDAGFHKYLIQHQFISIEEKNQTSTVAFWSNLLVSLIVWLIICFFSKDIALLVGCPGKEWVISISCACIPLASISSIHTALLKKDLNFKILFLVRFVGILIPLFVTIPLAVISHSYWALIMGMISLNVATVLILTIKSSWRPTLFFKIDVLKQMLEFSIWSMLESISIWLTGYADIFIVGSVLNQHFLGIYRTSMTTVGQIMALVTAATTSVLYSSLSRLQNDDEKFLDLFLKFQKIVGMFIIPLGFGIYMFRSLIVDLLLGNQWGEAMYFVGVWGLSGSLTIVLANYCSEVYRSKGKPKLSVLVQFLHIVVLLPVVLYFVNGDFETLCTARALVRLESIFVNMFFMYVLVKLSPFKMLKNVMPSMISSVIMFLCIGCLPESTKIIVNFSYVFIAILVYLGVLCAFSNERQLMMNLVKGKYKK